MARYRLNGQIVSNSDADIYRYFGYEVCCPQDVRRILDETPDDDITLEINSGGGSVYAGFEMYTALRESERFITAEVQSLAGSAMSVVIAACDRVLMSPVANIMIHRSSIRYTSGNAEKLAQDAQMLNTIDESILNAYEAKTGGKCTRTKLRHMMEDETFLTAQEAIDCGLADGMTESEKSETNPLEAVACASPLAAAIFHTFATLPPVEDLRKTIQERHSFHALADTGESTEYNTQKEGNEMEYNTKEELMDAFPELIAQIREDARAAEQQRIAEIDAVAMPGFEDVVQNAKADPKQNASTVAMAIIMQQKQQGVRYMQDARADAQIGNANAVPADGREGISDAGNDAEQEAKEAVAMWKKHKNQDGGER